MNHPLITSINNTPTPPAGSCALWWLGQHSFTLKLGDSVVWIDPFLSPLAGRLIPPACPPTAVTNATLILGTHDHIDHIDRDIWPAIAAASPAATFVVPEPARTAVIEATGLPPARIHGATFGNDFTINGVTIRPLPAAHEQLNRDPATGHYPYLGYVVEANGFRLYHAGDTCRYEGQHALLQALHCNLLILPINGRDAKRLSSGCIGNMTWQEAADLAGALAPQAVIPAHYEMFSGNCAPVDEFCAYIKIKYPNQKVIIPRHNNLVTLVANPLATVKKNKKFKQLSS
jgi:L-ascorbate metabolism protein UlaG (beta-lactamase superfamily)